MGLLKQYFRPESLQGLLSLNQKILSSPDLKPREYGTVKASVTSDRSLRTKIHHDIRRIFQSRIESSTDQQGDMVLSAAVPDHRKPGNQPGRNRQHQQRSRLTWDERGGEYLHFSLYKENKDTMEVISFLARQLKVNAKVFQFAGTKDRRGVTVQRASAHRVEAERLAGQNRTLRNAIVGDFEYHRQGLELGDLKGNEFTITLRDCVFDTSPSLSAGDKVRAAEQVVSDALRSLSRNGFINYYGLQRFGTFATSTDVVGVKILQGDFRGACSAILGYSDAALTAGSSEDKLRAEAIHLFQTTGQAGAALERLPRRFAAEASIIRHLGRHAHDYAGALQTIQRNLRLMYVHAYQSLVWNFAVGERWRLYGDTVVEGDLVLVNEHRHTAVPCSPTSPSTLPAPAAAVDTDGEPVILPAAHDRGGPHEDVFERARALTAAEAASGAYGILNVVLPLPGFDVLYPANKVGDFYGAFMGSARGGGLEPAQMRRPQRDFSLSGGYRKVLGRIGPDYAVCVRAYDAGDDDEEEQFVWTDKERLEARAGSEEEVEEVVGGLKLKKTKKTSPAVAAMADMDKEPGEEEEGEQREQNPAETTKLAVVLRMTLGASQYATMALRELTQGGAVAFKPDFGRRGR